MRNTLTVDYFFEVNENTDRLNELRWEVELRIKRMKRDLADLMKKERKECDAKKLLTLKTQIEEKTKEIYRWETYVLTAQIGEGLEIQKQLRSQLNWESRLSTKISPVEQSVEQSHLS